MWMFYAMTGVLTGGIVVKIIYPLARGGARRMAVAVMIALPLLSLAIYTVVGRPDLEGRYKVFDGAGAMLVEHYALLSKKPIETLTKGSPDDIGAMMALAEINLKLKHYPEALALYRRGVKASKEQNDVRHRSIAEVLGEAQVMANNGTVGEDAKETFEYVLTLHAENPIALYHMSLYKAQHGQRQEALDEWRVLLNDGHPNVWWKKRLRESIMRTREELRGETPAQ